MAHMRISEAALVLGISDDTVRRYAAAGRLHLGTDETGRQVIDSPEVAALATELHPAAPVGSVSRESARNRMTGIVTQIVSDRVMSQVELQCGPYRVVSLMSTEAVQDLRLEIGSVAVASVKATQVVVGVEAER